MSKTIRLIFTGITRRPCSQIHQLLRARHPDCEIDAHVVTWAGMNDARFFEVFNFATIHELEPTQYAAEIEAAAGHFGFKFPETVAFNTLSMFCCWNQAASLAEHGRADVVFKARVDNGLMLMEPDVGLLDHCDKLNIPAGGNHRGGVGDHICYGSPAYVAAYLRLFEHLPAYAAEGYALHPERLVALHTSRIIAEPLHRPVAAIAYSDGIYNWDLRPDKRVTWRTNLELSLLDTLRLYRRRNLLGGHLAAHRRRFVVARLLRAAIRTKWVTNRAARLKALFPLK